MGSWVPSSGALGRGRSVGRVFVLGVPGWQLSWLAGHCAL